MGALAKGSTQRPNIPNPRFPNRPQAALGQRVPAAPRAQRGVQYTPAARDEQANVEGGIGINIQNMARLKAEADAAKARAQYNRMAGQGSGPEVR
jgi:hypothetical protein